MALAHCNLGKFLGVGCHCFPPKASYICIEINNWYEAVLPVPVAARSKASVCGRSPAEIVGSNPTGDMDIFLL